MRFPKSFQLPVLDDNENIFFARELEQLLARSFDVKYPNLLARSMMQVDYSIPPGATSFRYEQYDRVGKAKIVSSDSDDLPLVDVNGKEFTGLIKSLGDAFRISIQEIRSAAMAGKPLESRRADAARRAMEEALDLIAFSGDAATGLKGFNNVPNALTYSVPTDGTSSSSHWHDKTPDQILRDMNGIVQYIRTQSAQTETPDTLVLPDTQFALISETARSTTSDTTILEFFKATNPFVKNVVPWWRLAGAGSGSADRMVAYRKNGDALMLMIPQEFESFPPQARGFSLYTPCHMRTGGVVCPYPFSVAYGDGI